MRRKRAAIFGGTFDPVHCGHVEAARQVQPLFAIDQVIFVVACVPPHKRNADITSAYHRVAMLALATQDDAAFRISTIELDNPDRPYAVDTVEGLQAELGPHWQLFFLMGTDSWSDLTSWHDWRRLLESCSPIVITRPGYEFGDAPPGTVINDVRGLSTDQVLAELERSKLPQPYLTDVARVDVSATRIRAAARAGAYEDLKAMVPAAVANYVVKHGLYTK